MLGLVVRSAGLRGKARRGMRVSTMDRVSGAASEEAPSSRLRSPAGGPVDIWWAMFQLLLLQRS